MPLFFLKTINEDQGSVKHRFKNSAAFEDVLVLDVGQSRKQQTLRKRVYWHRPFTPRCCATSAQRSPFSRSQNAASPFVQMPTQRSSKNMRRSGFTSTTAASRASTKPRSKKGASSARSSSRASWAGSTSPGMTSWVQRWSSLALACGLSLLKARARRRPQRMGGGLPRGRRRVIGLEALRSTMTRLRRRSISRRC